MTANLSHDANPKQRPKSDVVESTDSENLHGLVAQIKTWGKTLGFADVGISDLQLDSYEQAYFSWLDAGLHGDMNYMQAHGTKRTRPNELVPETKSVISVRINYFDDLAENALNELHQSHKAYISRYALGKDYHKLLRKRLQQLAEKIQNEVPDFQYRAFTDSAPVLEQALAEKAGLGFIGKNSLTIHPRAGSWFFLGELYTNLDLPADLPFAKQGCGPCTACIQECPTQAILDNNQIDARLCVSYLTIEYDGIIEETLREKIGNRIYGCDDCQLVCPWNRFAEGTQEVNFRSQYNLASTELLTLWQWNEKQFLNHFQGSPIRRIGFNKWQRNLAVAIGNIQQTAYLSEAIALLENAKNSNEMVQVHIEWAIQQLKKRQTKPESETKLINVKKGSKIKPFKVKKYYYPADKIRVRGRENAFIDKDKGKYKD